MSPHHVSRIVRFNTWLRLPLLCKLGLHWGEWKGHLNFHSHHAIQTWRCTRCPVTRARTVPALRSRTAPHIAPTQHNPLIHRKETP